MENMVNNPILVTGYSGFIGKKITNNLLKSGYSVCGIYNSHRIPDKRNLTQVKLDLFNEDEIKHFLQNNHFEKLLHLAWYVGDDCHNSEKNVLWLTSSINLINNFIKEGGKEVIVSGSNEEYDLSKGYLREDDIIQNPTSLYGICKKSLYEISQKLCNKNDVTLKWARIFHTYGVGEQESKLFSSVIRSILSNKKIELSACDNYIDYINVDDVSEAIVCLVKNKESGIFNICSGETYKLKEIVNYICNRLEYKGLVYFNAKKSKVNSKILIGDSTKLNSILGFTPKITLQDGINNLIEWWKKNV